MRLCAYGCEWYVYVWCVLMCRMYVVCGVCDMCCVCCVCVEWVSVMYVVFGILCA